MNAHRDTRTPRIGSSFKILVLSTWALAFAFGCGRTVDGGREEPATEPDRAPSDPGIGAPDSPVDGSVEPNQHRLLLLSSHDGKVDLVGQKLVLGKRLRQSPDLHHGAWSFDAVGADGKVLHRDNVTSPHFVRGEFAPEGGSTTPDHVEANLPGPQSLTIRVPYGAVSVRLYDVSLGDRKDKAPFATVELGGETP